MPLYLPMLAAPKSNKLWIWWEKKGFQVGKGKMQSKIISYHKKYVWAIVGGVMTDTLKSFWNELPIWQKTFKRYFLNQIWLFVSLHLYGKYKIWVKGRESNQSGIK